jgi:predicted PhzF superfamily epimerase YddE/YHI9
MPRRIFGVDAFTAVPFSGNPAAVCLLEPDSSAVEWPDEAWMQALAAEMNLSETAFVVPSDDAFGLRWFTPTSEVQLCGHATLASTHVLWETGTVRQDVPVKFGTRWKGPLVATHTGDAIALDFPAAPSTPVPEPDGLSAALGVPLRAVARNDLHHLVEVADASVVRSIAPDFAALREVDVEAVVVTAASDDGEYDFVSRYFAPRHGIDEDPVTGSAHTSLGPYWAAKLNKRDLVGYQASARGGEVRVSLPESDATRVTLGGHAVTVWRGELQG